MELKKMLLYLSLAFVIHSARSESSLTVKRINKELCLCDNSTYPTVADALDIDQSQLVRLVVYYYKDLTTGEILMLTPARNKQLMFPDLVIDTEDQLTTITNETVYEVLTPNPSFVSLYDNQKKIANSEVQVVQTNINKTDSNPIGFNEGYIETAKLPKQNGYIDVDHEYISENNSDASSSADNFSLYSDSEPEEADDEDFWDKPLSPTDYLQNDDRPFYKDESPWVSVNNENNLKHKPNKPILEAKPLQNDHGFNLDFDVNQPFDDDVTIDSILSENGAQDQEFNDQELSLSKLFGKYVTFDKWFEQQMLRINRTGKAPSLSLNVKSLKLLVERALYINNMYVTKDGVLIDSYGTALDVGNLKLRPILIGSSVTYDSLLDVTDNKFVLPTNKPYLEAVLVTLVYPPKILDVIPLGKSYVPRASYRKRYNYWPGSNKPTHQLKPKLNNCSSRLCNVWDSYSTGNDLSQSNKHHRLKGTLSEPIKFSKYSESRNRREEREKHRRERKINRKVKTSTHSDVLNNVLKVLGSFIDSEVGKKALKHHTKKDKAVKNYNNVNFRGEYDNDINDNDSDDNEDFNNDSQTPWFRIIGGNAATSSGTPVSSRGRSGASHEGSA